MTINTANIPLILASTSPFRKDLLGRMNLPFETCAPEVDESRDASEAPEQLVQRLSEAKARAAGESHQGLIIGSDQVAVYGEKILGKPGSHDAATGQLRMLSGQSVTFLTGLCLYNSVSENIQIDLVPFTVKFRELDDSRIEHYLRADQPYNCAGSFKSEGLGITLFEKMSGDDPTALIGLPLICLTTMLAAEGIILP
jgi:MAF protein